MKESPTDEEVLAAFPRLPINEDNVEHYRGRLQRRLLLNRCGSCGHWHNPPRPVCPRCWSAEVRPEQVSGRGVIDLLTVLHIGSAVPDVDYEAGYPLAAIALVEQPGLRFTASITEVGSGGIRIGMPVELAWAEREGAPLPVFRPAQVTA